MKYALVIEPLNDADGGGYLAFFPDLPGCMSDGESPFTALENGIDALESWLSVQSERQRPIPEAGSAALDGQGYIEQLQTEIERLNAELAKATQDLHRAKRERLFQGVEPLSKGFVAARATLRQTG